MTNFANQQRFASNKVLKENRSMIQRQDAKDSAIPVFGTFQSDVMSILKKGSLFPWRIPANGSLKIFKVEGFSILPEKGSGSYELSDGDGAHYKLTINGKVHFRLQKEENQTAVR